METTAFSSKLKSCLRVGFFIGAFVYAYIIAISLLHGSAHPQRERLDRVSLFEKALCLGVAAAFVSFVLKSLQFRKMEKLDDVLGSFAADDLSGDDLTSLCLQPGFVAMEYYGLILNRTFLVFIYPDGLRGWKISGLTTHLTPEFVESYLHLLQAPRLKEGPAVLEMMMKQPGSFFISRGEITSVSFDPSPKWGMAGIQHSGKIYVNLSSRIQREFILLNAQDGDEAREAILSGGSSFSR
jgi:hypothetical protein